MSLIGDLNVRASGAAQGDRLPFSELPLRMPSVVASLCHISAQGRSPFDSASIGGLSPAVIDPKLVAIYNGMSYTRKPSNHRIELWADCFRVVAMRLILLWGCLPAGLARGGLNRKTAQATL